MANETTSVSFGLTERSPSAGDFRWIGRAELKMNQHRVLVAGVSAYPPPVTSLKAVAADVREVAKLLGSPDGGFKPDEVLVLTDSDVSQARLLAALGDVFRSAGAD